jgi:hypothetical protein
MANFKITLNGPDISSFDLPQNRSVTLVQWGGDASGNKLDLTLTPPTPSVALAVSPNKVAAASTVFTVKGTSSGVTTAVGAYVPDTGQTQKYSEDLTLNVCGTPHKQAHYDVDLIANLATNGDASQIYSYSQILKSNFPSSSCPLSQNTTPGHYNCGDTAAAYGLKYFSKKTSVTTNRYYLPPTSDKMVDLRFDADKMANVIDRIKSLVNQGTSVRLWAIHHDGFKKVITGDPKTHYLTVVGYGADRFLYLDPWPGGSVLYYDGGMYPRVDIYFMGELIFNRANLSDGLYTSPYKLGYHTYRIIGGP